MVNSPNTVRHNSGVLTPVLVYRIYELRNLRGV